VGRMLERRKGSLVGRLGRSEDKSIYSRESVPGLSAIPIRSPSALFEEVVLPMSSYSCHPMMCVACGISSRHNRQVTVKRKSRLAPWLSVIERSLSPSSSVNITEYKPSTLQTVNLPLLFPALFIPPMLTGRALARPFAPRASTSRGVLRSRSRIGILCVFLGVKLALAHRENLCL
jgi:hypothetical protein